MMDGRIDELILVHCGVNFRTSVPVILITPVNVRTLSLYSPNKSPTL